MHPPTCPAPQLLADALGEVQALEAENERLKARWACRQGASLGGVGGCWVACVGWHWHAHEKGATLAAGHHKDRTPRPAPLPTPAPAATPAA